MLHTVVIAGQRSQVKREHFSEEFLAGYFKRLKHITVKRERALEVENVPRDFGKTEHHLALLSTKYPFLSGMERFSDRGKLMQERFVELAQQKKEDKTGVRPETPLVQHRTRVKNLGNEVEGLAGAITDGDEELLAEDEVNLLVVLLRRAPYAGEVKNEVYQVVVKVHLGLQGRSGKLVHNKRVEAVLICNAANFVL